MPPKETIDSLIAQSNLTHSAKPWHLKVSVTYPDGGHAQVEEWFVSPEKRRRIVTSKAFNQTETILGTDVYQDGDRGILPQTLEAILQTILHPGPSQDRLATVTLERTSKVVEKAPLDCIVLDPETKKSHPAIGRFPTYCFDPETQKLRVTYRDDGSLVVANGIGRFLGNQVPTQFTLSVPGMQLADASIETLEVPGSIPNDIFTAKGQLTLNTKSEQQSDMREDNDRISPETKIKFSPASVRQKHAKGVVRIQTNFSEQGVLESLSVIGSPDPDLAMAAVEAVRHWQYKPYQLNGTPAKFVKTVTMNYGEE